MCRSQIVLHKDFDADRLLRFDRLATVNARLEDTLSAAHKVAGALAENGADLATITEAAEQVIAGTMGLGMSLNTCTVPGSPKEQRIPEGKAELGLGIHGEAGIEQVDFAGATQAMRTIAGRLAGRMGEQAHAAILNNLGGASALEMSVLANEVASSEIGGRLKLIVGPAAMMTSLDMRGFSVSVCPLDNERERLLTQPCALSARPGAKTVGLVETRQLPDGLAPIKPLPSQHAPTEALLRKCCEILIASEADLNYLDAKCGDGDTGSTLAGAARALIAALPRLPLADHTQLYRAIGQELSQTMGGSSGVLLAIFFTAAGDGASSGMFMQDALKAGLQRMREIGGASVGDRTMVDALHPALEALHEGIGAAARAARSSADHTATLEKANAGRAAYVSADRLKSHADPGAEAVARLFEQLQPFVSASG